MKVKEPVAREVHIRLPRPLPDGVICQFSTEPNLGWTGKNGHVLVGAGATTLSILTCSGSALMCGDGSAILRMPLQLSEDTSTFAVPGNVIHVEVPDGASGLEIFSQNGDFLLVAGFPGRDNDHSRRPPAFLEDALGWFPAGTFELQWYDSSKQMILAETKLASPAP